MRAAGQRRLRGARKPRGKNRIRQDGARTRIEVGIDERELGADGLVARRRDGNFARYSIADETVFAICEQVCGGLRARLAELEAAIEEGVKG